MNIYIQPPKPTASREEWERWLKANDNKERARKAKQTKETPWIALPETQLTKRDGRWVQSENLAFVGDFENGTGEITASDENTAESILARKQARRKQKARGVNCKAKNKRRARNRRIRKQLEHWGYIWGSKAYATKFNEMVAQDQEGEGY